MKFKWTLIIIMKALRKFFFFEKRILYCLNQWLMPKRAADFAKRTSCEIRYLELFNNNAKGRRIGRMAEYLYTRNDGIYYNEVCLLVRDKKL